MAVTVRVDPAISDRFTRLFGDQVVERSGGGEAVLEFPGREAAITMVAAFGGGIEVLAPPDLRERLAELAAQLSALYGPAADTA